ncbi:MAG: IS110 family transposase [Pseudomonadota bacterium]|nr:IS110 family transposase [Pseudomonadota bacterium]
MPGKTHLKVTQEQRTGLERLACSSNRAQAGRARARCGSIPVKDVDQQSVLMLHRVRNLLIRQRTMLVNAHRAHMAEFGLIAPQGLAHVERLVAAIDDEQPLPELARSILRLVVTQLNDTQAKIWQLEAKRAKWHRQNRLSCLLATVPGVGIMGASAIAATVANPSLFRSGRAFAAWLGMTPRQNSSGGKERLGRTSKRGDKYIRCLLVAEAVAILCHARNRTTKDAEAHASGTKAREVVAVALATRPPYRLGRDDPRRSLPSQGGYWSNGRLNRPQAQQFARVKRT